MSVLVINTATAREICARDALIPYERFKEVRFFGSLDGLRALSILGVVWVHSWIGTPGWTEHAPLTDFAEVGVNVFFTISGFLITTLLLRERAKYGKVSLRNFYIRRTLRIWPLYYGMLAVYVGLVLLTERHTERGQLFFHCLPMYATYTYTWFGPGAGESGAIFNFAWTLCTEEQFYMAWPLVVKFIRQPWPILVMVGVIAVRMLAGLGMLGFVGNALMLRMIMSVAVPICLGAILAQVLDSRRGFEAIYTVLGNPAAAPVALVLVVLAGLYPMAEPAVLNWAAYALLVAACVVREDHGLARLLRFKPLAMAGVLSYGMYLMNTLIIKVARPGMERIGLGHPALVFVVAVLGTFGVAWVSYRFYESRFLALKQKYAKPRTKVSAGGEIARVARDSAQKGTYGLEKPV